MKTLTCHSTNFGLARLNELPGLTTLQESMLESQVVVLMQKESESDSTPTSTTEYGVDDAPVLLNVYLDLWEMGYWLALLISEGFDVTPVPAFRDGGRVTDYFCKAPAPVTTIVN